MTETTSLTSAAPSLPPLYLFRNFHQSRMSLIAWQVQDESLREPQLHHVHEHAGFVTLRRRQRQHSGSGAGERQRCHSEGGVQGMSVVNFTTAMAQTLISLLKDLDLSIALPATPAFICCVGMRVVEYRIFVACRNATVYAAARRHYNSSSSCTRPRQLSLSYDLCLQLLHQERRAHCHYHGAQWCPRRHVSTH